MIAQTLRRASGPEGSPSDRNLQTTVQGLIVWIVISTGIVFCFSLTAVLDAPTFWTWLVRLLAGFATAMLVGGSSFATGALLGFLFGIPRTVQRETEPAPPQAGGGPAIPNAQPRQTVNTNLEQISDWLTKILVGVGLTQLQQMPDQLWRLGQAFPLGGTPSLGLALILNFLIGGFFCGYLLTRLFLAGAFQEVEYQLAHLSERAAAFQEAGAHGRALSEYERALASITATTARSEKRRIYEGVVINSLYEQAPGGFERAIQYAQRYLTEEPSFPSARILAYLTAAYGQQYTYRRNRGDDEARLNTIKGLALDAATQALRVDPEIKPILQMLWDPHYPGKNAEENDLEVFYADADFTRLLGGP